MDILIFIAVFWAFGKALKAILGGWSESDYRRDR